MLKLHGIEVSGNTYKARLLMSLLDIKYQLVEIDIHNQQHKSKSFLKINPRGEFPALETSKTVIWDSQAILIYLSRISDNKSWYPNSPTSMAEITQWLTVANDEIFHSLGKARSILQFGYPGDLNNYQRKGKQVLHWLNKHLEDRKWLATDNISIADIACYPYIALCEEGEISLKKHKAILNWIDRIQHLDNYINMPGLPYCCNR